MSEAAPTISVVIAALQPGAVLLDCLGALEAQRQDDLEVLVVDAGGDVVMDQVRARHPWIRIIDAHAERSLPKLRGAGMAEARGEIVGVLDAWCMVNDRWIRNALHVHRENAELVAGGGVDLEAGERRSLRAWATYLFDYWEFVAPFGDAYVPVLPGNNITYKRAALPDRDTLRAQGFWKAFTNARLTASGHRLVGSTGLAVRMKRRLPLGRFLRSRYHHGRSYAAMRVEQANGHGGWKRALITPGLPLLFLSRQARGLASKSEARLWFIACLPLLLAFHASWAYGELCGYVLGAGGSHDAIRS